MKRLFVICISAALVSLAGCSDDDEQPDPQLPPLVWPDDEIGRASCRERV